MKKKFYCLAKDKMKWKNLIYLVMVIMMSSLANAQISATLNGIRLKTSTDFLEINFTIPFKFGTDITSIVYGSQKRNEIYYPYISFRVLNPNFWFGEVNITELINCTSEEDSLETQCSQLNYTINRTKKLRFSLGFNRDITEEYIEGWDWHNVNLGKDWSFNADFRCYYGNQTSIGRFEAINSKTNQIDVDVDFNFTGVNANDIVKCEDPIYNVKKFFDEFGDLSQWDNDGLGNWFAESGVACSGVGCASGGACSGGKGTSSNMSISYDIDLSDCVNGTAYVNFSYSESGTSDPEDCLNTSYSIDGGSTWILRNTTFCDDLTAIRYNGFKIPNESYSSQFRWRFRCHNFQAAGENVNIQMFNITCNSTKAVVSNCGNLNTGNVQYNLRKNVNSTGTCFNITASNNTLDCHGYNIDYSTSTGTGSDPFEFGISNENLNTFVRSCNITQLRNSANQYRDSAIFLQSSYFTLFNSSIWIDVTDNTVDMIIYDITNTISAKKFASDKTLTNISIINSILRMVGGNINTRTLYFADVHNISFINVSTYAQSSVYEDIILDNVTSFVFLNTSFNKSNIIQFYRPPAKDSKANFTVKWYLTINVSNNTGQPITDAEIVVNDTNAVNVFKGNSNLVTTIVTEYTQNGSVDWNNLDSCSDVTSNINLTCFTPHRISANFSGYDVNSSTYKMNRSRLVNVLLGIAGGAPPPDPCAYVSGDYIISDGSNCVITADTYVNGKCIVESGAIRVETGTLTCTKGCSKRMVIGNYFTRRLTGGRLICGKS